MATWRAGRELRLATWLVLVALVSRCGEKASVLSDVGNETPDMGVTSFPDGAATCPTPTLSDPISVSGDLPSITPSIAQTSDGTLFIVWQGHNGDPPGLAFVWSKDAETFSAPQFMAPACSAWIDTAAFGSGVIVAVACLLPGAEVIYGYRAEPGDETLEGPATIGEAVGLNSVNFFALGAGDSAHVAWVQDTELRWASSQDGASWKPSVVLGSVALDSGSRAFAEAAGNIVWIGASFSNEQRSVLYRSEDGLSFAEPIELSGRILHLAARGNGLVAIYFGPGFQLLRSADGVTFSSIALPLSAWLPSGLAWDGAVHIVTHAYPNLTWTFATDGLSAQEFGQVVFEFPTLSAGFAGIVAEGRTAHMAFQEGGNDYVTIPSISYARGDCVPIP